MAKRAQQDELRLSLPIFFATDREAEQKKGNEFDYGDQIIEPIDAISYGIRQQETKARIASIGPGKDWGWTIVPEKGGPGAAIAADTASASSHEFATVAFAADRKDALFARVRSALAKCDRKEIVVFVHGCCLTFKESMRQAAALESRVKVPVIAYCWGCSLGYAGSNLAYPRTQERFNDFMTSVMREFPEERITLVGNSLGNSVIISFCLQRRVDEIGRRLNNIFLARADVDAVAFKSQVKYLKNFSDNVILYVASNDPQINISGVLRWFAFPTQHGERVGNLRSMLQTESSVMVLDVSPLKMKHTIPYQSIADIVFNNGVIPDQSNEYVYKRESDNLVRVSPIEKAQTSKTSVETPECCN
ncbi:MAG TPA: alpha/beta hydrolase [Candidatus Obscuribacterales bacterium]